MLPFLATVACPVNNHPFGSDIDERWRKCRRASERPLLKRDEGKVWSEFGKAHLALDLDLRRPPMRSQNIEQRHKIGPAESIQCC